METSTDHGVPASQVAAATPPLGTLGAGSARDPGGAHLARLDLAAAETVRGGVTLPALDRLLESPLDAGVNAQNGRALIDAAYPTFHDDDLPAPLFHDDDLPAPLFDDDDLPAPQLHAYDLPVDLAAIGLRELLGLELSGGGLPTVGEVVRVSAPGNQANKVETKDANDDDRENVSPDEDDTETPGDDSAVPNDQPGDLSFIDPRPLTEQAATNDADAAVGVADEGEPLGLDAAPSLTDGTSDGAREFNGRPVSVQGSGENSGGSNNVTGGGNNVINGTPGDDVLVGTAGADIINAHNGNDFIDGGAGADKLHGQNGDDIIIWDAADSKIDGGNGIDTLRIFGDADFTAFGGTINKIEIVDLATDAGANALTLTVQDVLNFTDNGNTLTITGAANDSFNAGNGWTYGGVDGGGYDIYTQTVGPETATLLVDPTISANANILL